MYNDSLFRVSFKCIIRAEINGLHVVQERGCSSWDLTDGGMEHGEIVGSVIEGGSSENDAERRIYGYLKVSLA